MVKSERARAIQSVIKDQGPHPTDTKLTNITVPNAPRARKRIGESVDTLLDSLKIIPLPRLVFDKPRRTRGVACRPEPEAMDLGGGVEHELGDSEVPKRGKVNGWDCGVEFHACLGAACTCKGRIEREEREKREKERRGRGEDAGNQKSEFRSLQPTRFYGERRGYLLKSRARTGLPQDVGVPGAEMPGWG